MQRKVAKASPRAGGLFARLRRFGARLISWRIWAAVLAVLVILPLATSLLYRWEAVHPVSTLMLYRWATLKPVDRQWVEIDDMAPVLRNSVLMSEDGQFCTHRGIDWDQMRQVLDRALAGEATRGASTVSMQTAKNLFLWPARSYVRKALEIPLALWLDLVLPKKRLMELYLNIAEWDEGVFGAEAAARHYFGRSASRLTSVQAALLTVALPAPRDRNPARPSRQLTRLAETVRKRAAQSGAYNGCVR